MILLTWIHTLNFFFLKVWSWKLALEDLRNTHYRGAAAPWLDAGGGDNDKQRLTKYDAANLGIRELRDKWVVGCCDWVIKDTTLCLRREGWSLHGRAEVWFFFPLSPRSF